MTIASPARPRILMLAPNPAARGPIPRLAPLLVEAIASHGYQIMLEPWGRRHDGESPRQKVTNRCRDIAHLRALLRRRRFDMLVINTSHEWPSLLQAVPLLTVTRRLVSTVVVQFHGGHSELLEQPGHRMFKLTTAIVIRMTDGVLVLSSAEAQHIARFNRRVPVHVVANAFRPSVSGPSEHAEHVPDGQPLRFLFVGRLIAEKGIFEMLSAFASVSARHKCRLVLVGDGPRAADVARRIAELGVTEKVTMKGFLAGDELGATYRNADVFVFPSYSEGFPTVIAEALHAGLPIVTTRIRGMADHLVEGRHALFVAPREVDRLAGALERLLLDADLRRRMGSANREKVADFAPSIVAADYLDALTEIARKPRPTVAPR